MTAFVYSWHDKLTNKFYIGSHKGSIDDGYICSSKHMLAEYHQRPNDFERTIISVHATRQDALDAEAALLESVDAKNNPKYYNLSNNGNKDWVLTEDARKRIGEANRKRIYKDSTRTKHSRAKKGRIVSEQTRQQISESHKARWAQTPHHCLGTKTSEERKNKIRLAHLGKPKSDEARKKMSEAAKKRFKRNILDASHKIIGIRDA